MLNKKIKKIFIGTNNHGKLREISTLLPKALKIYSINDLEIKSPKETGNSFLKNSIITISLLVLAGAGLWFLKSIIFTMTL